MSMLRLVQNWLEEVVLMKLIGLCEVMTERDRCSGLPGTQFQRLPHEKPTCPDHQGFYHSVGFPFGLNLGVVVNFVAETAHLHKR